MIHRRLIVDDWRGVFEPLNETDKDGEGLRQSVRHYVMFEGNHRQVQKWNDQRILPTFAPSSTNTFSKFNLKKAPIPVNDNLKLYLRPFEDGTYLLRLHNMNRSGVVGFSLPAGWKFTEQTLAANQLVSDWKKKQFTWN